MEAANPSIGLGASHGVAEAPLIVHSQRLPLNPRGICTWCGRANDSAWNVCKECPARRVPHQGPMPVAGPSSSTSTVKQKSYVNCVSCSVIIHVQNYHSNSYTLCPNCQDRRPSIKPKPQKRSQPRANPYPSLSPLPTGIPSLDSPFIFPPPSAFFSVSVPPQNVNIHANGNGDLRVCMRYGCGARLPMYRIGDMCEACARAGFVRPPSAVVPKRVPRRAKERTHPLPRESIDLVRASLLREAQAIQGFRLTSAAPPPPDMKHADDSMDLDLVYPEDTLETVHPTPTNSELMIQGCGPPADDDADIDPDLVYPEDDAEAGHKSAPKSRTGSPSPASQSQFFMGSLQPMPALGMVRSDDATPKDPDPAPLRQCKMPGCNEVSPSVTSMQRCIKCSLDYWKQRKQAAFEGRSTPSRAGPGSLTPTADTPVAMTSKDQEAGPKLPEAGLAEGKAASDGMHGQISDVEELPGSDVPPRSSSPTSNSNSDGQVADPTIGSIPGWDSDLADLSSSEDEESDSESEAHNDTLKIRIPLFANQHSSDGSVRKCANKRCNIALSRDHRWKTCDPCRRAQRHYHRIRNENMRGCVAGVEGDGGASPEPPESYEPSASRRRSASADLTPETSRPCSVKHCRIRIPLPEVYRWKMCATCRARARRDARRKKDVLSEIQNSSPKPGLVLPFPAYQNRAVLLSSFGTQLQNFVEGQILYFRTKLHKNGEGELSKLTPMVFTFDGEYSIVTTPRGEGDSKPPGEDTGAMCEEVFGVVQDLNYALRTKFRSGEAFAIDTGGIVMRFTCSLGLVAPLRPLPLSIEQNETSLQRYVSDEIEEGRERKSPPPVPLMKTLSGELEVVIAPDNAHKLFHGRRTIIRYRMLG